MKLRFRAYFLIKVFYFGENYHGLQRQPNLPTIEGELIKTLTEKNYLPKKEDIPNQWNIPLYAAGRTDAGVSARNMVFGLLSLRDKFYPIEVNLALPKDIKIWAYAKLNNEEELNNFINNFINKKGQNNDKELSILDQCKQLSSKVFLPRYNALYREYRYYLFKNNTTKDLDHATLKKAIKKLLGKHDFYNFCKNDPDNIKNTNRTMDEISFIDRGTYYVFNFRAKSFLWKQIRKTMDVLIKVGTRKWPLSHIDRLFSRNETALANSIEPVSGFPLILWDVKYDQTIEQKFEYCPKSMAEIEKILANLISYLEIKSAIAEDIWGSIMGKYY
ncbi:MAG: tRNA pseudouridine(38-40) synthase TruA [Promethearchaeota archaeon]